VSDVEAPVITCPANINSPTDPGLAIAVVFWNPPVSSDNVAVVSLTPSPVGPSSSFSLGTTTVTYTALDAAANVGTCSFTVTVVDQEAPVLTCNTNGVILNTDPGQAFAAVDYAAAGLTVAAVDNVGVVGSPVAAPPSNAQFAVGGHNVVYTVSDSAGNTGTVSCSFTVQDIENPTVSCPAPVTQNTDAGSPTATVTWTVPTANDNTAVATLTSSFNPGAAFPVGTTTVTYSVADIYGNPASCSFDVTVSDNEIPVVSCPANIVQSTDTGLPTAVISWSVAVATDNLGVASEVESIANGTVFPVGTTSVTRTATDVTGLVATCTFTVNVVDNENPSVTCPANIVQASDPGLPTAVVTFAATYTDNVGVTAVVTTHNSGTPFTLGSTTVSYDVSDQQGNRAVCSFTVTIVDQEKPTITCPPSIINPTSSGQGNRQVSWTVPVSGLGASDNQGIMSIVSSASSGDFFAVGTTTVIYTATDLSYNNKSCTFTVTIVDTESPVINCPNDIVQPTDPGVITANVTWMAPSASDNVGIHVASSTHNPSEIPGGYIFPLGATDVSFGARDLAGNVKNCTWVVTVVDQEPPVLTCPSNSFILLEIGESSHDAFWPTAVATDNHRVVSLTANATSGDNFPIGNTPVTYVAADPSGNVARCTFVVTVSDFLPNITLSDRRTGWTGTEVTVYLRPQYSLAGGSIEIYLPGFTGTPTINCNRGWSAQLPDCRDGWLTGQVSPASEFTGLTSTTVGADGKVVVQLKPSASLNKRTGYTFGIAGLTNPTQAGPTLDLGVVTKNVAGAELDVNRQVLPLDIMSVVLSAASLTVQENSFTTFTVHLDTWPSHVDHIVRVRFNSSNAQQAILVPHTVSFSMFDYNVSQTVMVYGIRDLVDDDNQVVSIIPTVVTTDPKWDGLPVDPLTVTVVDADTWGVTVQPQVLMTNEGGAIAQFTVVLNSRPTHAVTMVITSENTNENTVSPSSIVIQPIDWNIPRTVTVTGVDDLIADGDQITTIQVQPVSLDPRYNNMVLRVNVTNLDDDVTGILVYPSNGTTTEGSVVNGKAFFHVKLASKPNGVVVVQVQSTDTSEGVAFPPDLHFDQLNWNQLQTFEVRSVDDNVQDGDITYQVTLAASSTDDPKYNAGAGVVNHVWVTNKDTDFAGVEWFPPLTTFLTTTEYHEVPRTSTTSEARGANTLKFWLHTRPVGPLRVLFTSSDPTQGYASPSVFTIAPEEWRDRSWNITLRGSDDLVNDADTPFTIFVRFEGDPSYAAKNYSFRVVNLATKSEDPVRSTRLIGICIATPLQTFSPRTFIGQAAAAFGVTPEEVNVDSYRACTDEDQLGTAVADWTYVKFKPQSLTGGTLVWWQIAQQTASVNLVTLEATMMDKLTNDAATRNALTATGSPYWIEGYKTRNNVPGACPRSIVRYFGVTLEVMPVTLYSPVSPIVWAVRTQKNTNPIWAAQRYASDPLVHPHDGLRVFAETGDVAKMVSELALRKAKGHLESYGAAYADPSHPAEVVKGQQVHFGFFASPGDYLHIATKMSRSNDRFYGNTEYGAPLFDDQCNPQWGTDVPMHLWDAGTAQDQPFWANLRLGKDSRQIWGGSYHLGQVAESQPVYQVPDAMIQDVNDPYPAGRDLLRTTIVHGLDVTLEPLVNSYKGANATIQVALPHGSDLGNELRIEFPAGWFGFDADGMPTTAQILAGMDGMVDYPRTVVKENIVHLQFTAPITLSSRMVTIMLDNLLLPSVCGELEYRLTTHQCVDHDLHNAGKYPYRRCSPAIVNATGTPPNGMPRGCSACNGCVYDFTAHGNDWFTCWTPDGTSFLRIGPLAGQCAENPYSLPGYPFP